MKPRIRAIRKAVKYLREEPERFNMGRWIAKKEFDDGDWRYVINTDNFGKEPQCGMVCCFAGAIFLANQGAKGLPKKFDAIKVANWARVTERTFSISCWPPYSYGLYLEAKTHTDRIDTLVSVIKEMLGVDAEPKREMRHDLP